MNPRALEPGSRHHIWAVRHHTGIVGSLLFIWSSTGHRSSQVFGILPAFSCICGRALLVREMMYPYFSVGPSRQRRDTCVLSRRAGSSGISWQTFSFVKETLHRHRAGFESQRATPFMKKVKASQVLGKAVRAWTMIPILCYPLHCWWCWRALPAAITLLWNRYTVQTTIPSGLGTSENGW